MVIESLKKLKEAAGKTYDSWSNVLFGLGVLGRDKRMRTTVSHEVLQQDVVEELYSGDDVARKVVDKIPHEGVRKGFEITGIEKPESVKKINVRTKDLGVMAKLEKAWNWARLYGGSGILIGVSDGQDNLEKPLDIKTVKKVNSLTVLNRWELTANSSTIEKDLKEPNFGMPNFYQLSGGRTEASGQQIHYTRIIRFEGSRLPQRKFETNNYWHDSVLSALNSVVRDFNMAHDTLPNVIADFRIGILRLKGIADLLAAGKQSAVINRLQSFDLTKSSYKTAVLDEDESYDIISKNLGGMKDIMDKIDNRLVSATNMPHTIILGKSPSGSLGSKGESENRDFMDLVSEQQRQVLTEPIIKILTLLFSEREGGITGGTIPDEFGIEFNPLWQMDEKEMAEVHKIQSEADEKYLTTGVLEPSEVAISRFGKGTFSLETVIDLESRKEVADSDMDFDIEEEFALIREVNDICNAIDKSQYIVEELADEVMDNKDPYIHHCELCKTRLVKLKEEKHKCEKCGKRATETHHKDKTKTNHKVENLMALCISCHRKLHGKARKDGEFIVQDATRVLQTIIIMKSIASTIESAEKIAEGFGKVVTSRETENSFRFRQRTPGDFKKGSFAAFHPKGKQGVTLLFGELK